jgi:serine/threonine protein kinase
MKKETDFNINQVPNTKNQPLFPELADSQFHFTLDNKNDKIKYFGSSSVVYKISDGKNNWALKYFTTSLLNRWEYLKKVQDKLNSLQKDWIIPFSIADQQDIKLDPQNEHIHPGHVILMPWINGTTLHNLVEQYSISGNKKGLLQLLTSFVDLVKKHATENFSHGDLSPENIMVTEEGKMILIDHDSFMFGEWTETAGQGYWSSSYQHPYRHPLKPDIKADDFAQLLHTICLKALFSQPGLYKTYNSTKGLLFTIDDFKSPEDSAIIKEMLNIKDTHLTRLINLLITHLQKNTTAIPGLIQYLSENNALEINSDLKSEEKNIIVEKEINELVENKLESDRLIHSLNQVVAKEIAMKEKIKTENKRLKEELSKAKNWLSMQKHSNKIKIAALSALAIVSVAALSIIAFSTDKPKYGKTTIPSVTNTVVNSTDNNTAPIKKESRKNIPTIESKNDKIQLAKETDTSSAILQGNDQPEIVDVESILKEIEEMLNDSAFKDKNNNQATAKSNSKTTKKKPIDKPIKKNKKEDVVFRQTGF